MKISLHALMLPTILLFYNTSYSNARSSSAPYISGDSFRAIADHIFDETDQSLDPKKINYKDTIFVNADILSHFFANIHPHIQNKYFLITHNSDAGVPGIFEAYLNDEKIILWFGQNPTIMNHPKFIPLPIGLANNHWPYGKTQVFDLVLHHPFNDPKQYLMGINFHTTTNPSLRKTVYNYFSQKSFCTLIYATSHQTYLELIQQSKFILSPEGDGLDCYRTWEALLMGSIPVVQTSMLDPIFSDLPVLIIDNWHNITEELLNQKYMELENNKKNYNYEKLYFAYWENLINNYKNIIE